MPKRVDGNQKNIVRLLREMGATVQYLHEVGSGCPDLLVGYKGANYIFEVKNPDKPPSQRKLLPDQEHWHLLWRGQVDTVMTLYDILEILKKKHSIKVLSIGEER